MMSAITEEWITWLEEKGKSPATVKAYRAGLQHFLGGWKRATANPLIRLASSPAT